MLASLSLAHGEGWEIIPYIRMWRLMECKNKPFNKQPLVGPGREPLAVHSSGVETKAAKGRPGEKWRGSD